MAYCLQGLAIASRETEATRKIGREQPFQRWQDNKQGTPGRKDRLIRKNFKQVALFARGLRVSK
jgi:hypothetical protein